MIRDNNYYTKHGWMINKLGLKGYELEVYAIVYSFSQVENQYCTCSINYMAEWNDCSRRTIERCLRSLTEKNIIIKVSGKRGFSNMYRANLVLLGCDIVSQGVRHGVAGGCDMVSHNNNIYNKKNKKTPTQKYNDFSKNKYNYELLEKELVVN